MATKASFAATRLFIGFSSLLCVGAAPGAPSYTLTDLGTLGGSFGQAMSVNDSGEIAGFAAKTSNESILPASGSALAALSQAEALGGNYGTANAINGSGQIAGSSAVPGDSVPNGYLAGGPAVLDLGAGSQGLGINSLGDVTGAFSAPGVGQQHGFIYQNGRMQDLGTLGGNLSQGNGINSAKQVTGFSALANGQQHAILWQNGIMTDLGTLGGSYSEGYAINEAGDVAGYATTPNNAQQHATLWSFADTVIDLGTLGGSFSEAHGINSLRQIVGTSHTVGELQRHGFLWESGVMTDLNALIPAAGAITVIAANSISDTGLIAGVGRVGTEFHAILLTPEPGTQPPSTTPGPPPTLPPATGPGIPGSSANPGNPATPGAPGNSGTTNSGNPTAGGSSSSSNPIAATGARLVLESLLTKPAAKKLKLGATLVFRMRISNAGTAVAPGLTLETPLSSKLGFRKALPSQGSCTAPARSKSKLGGTVRCQLGSLAPGQSVTVDITAQARKRGAVISNGVVSTAEGATASAEMQVKVR